MRVDKIKLELPTERVKGSVGEGEPGPAPTAGPVPFTSRCWTSASHMSVGEVALTLVLMDNYITHVT